MLLPPLCVMLQIYILSILTSPLLTVVNHADSRQKKKPKKRKEEIIMKHNKHVEQQGTNTTQHTNFITATQKLEINTYSKELHHSESTHVESFVREHWTKIPVGR